jgi:hypothetical protein
MSTLSSLTFKQSILFSNHGSAAAAAAAADRNSGSTGASDSHGILPTVNYLEFLSAALKARSEEEASKGSGSARDAAGGSESGLRSRDVSDAGSAVCLSSSSSSSSSFTASSSLSSSSSARIQLLVSEKFDLFYQEILEFPRRLSGLCDHSADYGPKKFQTTGNVSVYALFISTAADIVHKNVLRNLLPFNDCNGKLHGIFSEVKFDVIGRAVVVAWLYIVRVLGAAVSHDVLQNMSAEELIFLAECSLDFLLKLHTQHGSDNTTSSSCSERKDKNERKVMIDREFSIKMEGAVLSMLQRIMMIWSRDKDENCSLNSNNDINNDRISDNDDYCMNDDNGIDRNDESDEMSHGLRTLRRAWILIGYVEYLMMIGANKRKERGSNRDKDEKGGKGRDKGMHKQKDRKKENELGVGVRKERRVSSRIMGERMDIDNEEKQEERLKEKEKEKDLTGNDCSLNLEHV